MIYDIAIIGAGINGCSVAYEMTQLKKNVALFDKEGIAQGGSGAAGAFISPKFSKAGDLKEVINEAFLYSMKYYAHHFPQHFTQTQLLHIAKDYEEEEMLRVYKHATPLQLKTVSDAVYESLTPQARGYEHISIDGGVVDAKKMCEAMAHDATLYKEEITSLHYNEKEEVWSLNDSSFYTKEVVIATGAYNHTLLYEPYIQLRGVWGHRIDIQTTTRNPYSIHQYVSISPSQKGELAIGATHNVHYHPQTATKPYDVEAGREELLKKASQTIQLENVKVVRDYTGLRSGSFDYMPLVGPLVKSEDTLACCIKRLRVKRPDFRDFIYYPHLSMINGSGGYGFVLAPFLATLLKEYILKNKTIDTKLVPARFFARWAKRR